jgi:Tol biopolymer transport system component
MAWDDSDPSRTGIYTARASDGGDLSRVTTRPGLLVDVPLDYSPDGRKLLFYRSAHPDPDPHTDGSLWVVGVDGKSARQINGTAHPADWARWSPDGRKILFATERLAASGAIWTVWPDGSDLRQLFTDTAGGFPITPTWSPGRLTDPFRSGSDQRRVPTPTQRIRGHQCRWHASASGGGHDWIQSTA